MAPLARPRPPKRMENFMRAAKISPTWNPAILALTERKAEFDHPMAPALAGIALHGPARDAYDLELDRMWADAAKVTEAEEVVIGGGLHAAIYCAVRVANGHAKPLVLEASDRVGGAFAMSKMAAFYLNSRNRPGGLGVPGTRGALNVIPGAPIQPADLSGDEYQRNIDLAFAIRSTLMLNARVNVGARVTEVRETNGQDWRYLVRVTDCASVLCNRVIRATGLGEARRLTSSDPHPNVLTFPEFMAGMDAEFPLRGMRRIAVIGAGDSGRTVIEALTGQGPSNHWSVASLDYPDQIDWWGGPDMPLYRARWEDCNRSRYRGIGRALPRFDGGTGRVTPIAAYAQQVSGGFREAYVNERPYDLVIVCAGFQTAFIGLPSETSEIAYVGARAVGRKITGHDLYGIGAGAQLDVTDQEKDFLPAVAAVQENATALFRYAGRTAALADDLPIPGLVKDFMGRGSYTVDAKPANKYAIDRGYAIDLKPSPDKIEIPIAGGRASQVAKAADTAVAINLSDSEGYPLTLGDQVQVTDSSRYGDVRGKVTGNEDGRVVIALDLTTSSLTTSSRASGFPLDDAEAARAYTSSTRRVKAINPKMPF